MSMSMKNRVVAKANTSSNCTDYNNNPITTTMMGELLYSLPPSTVFNKNSLGKDGLQITVKKT